VQAALSDRADYDRLYQTEHARVLRLCRLLLSDANEAEDVTQEVFLKLFQAVEAGDSFAWAPWLTRVAVNACHDRRRSGWWKWWRREHQEFEEAQFSNSPLSSTPSTTSSVATFGSHSARCRNDNGKSLY